MENDEHEAKGLLWLGEEAQRLEDDGLHDDPLLKPEQKAAMMKNYNLAEKELLRYRRTQMVKEYPGLRDTYKVLGWEFDDPNDEPTEEPLTEPIPEQKASYADWLED